MKRHAVSIVLSIVLVMVPVSSLAADMPSEDSSYEIIQQIDKFFQPIFGFISNAIQQIGALQVLTCGYIQGGFTPGNYPLNPPLIEVGSTPREMAYAFGSSLGAPIGMVRALSEREDINLRPTLALSLFLLAAVVFEVFVIALAMAARVVRFVISTIIEIYKLIPFKST